MWSLPIIAGFASVGVAQYSGWNLSAGQNDTRMCTWRGLQAAVVRDTVYMDGGDAWWRPQFSDGEYGQVQEDIRDIGRRSFSLNFSTPFNVSLNTSALFQEIQKGPTAALYAYGAMLANDDEYFLYGGSYAYWETAGDPNEDSGYEYKIHNYANGATNFDPGYTSYDLQGLTRNVAYGGSVNVPSENLSFYFSGLRSPTWDQTVFPVELPANSAVNVSNTLISLDLTTQNFETWTNTTLPDRISGRASPELVWVPVGEQGILVALGGVVYPDFATAAQVSANETENEAQSPKFMTNVDIYDIANDEWYTQSTSGKTPGALTQGCAVMQPAQDYSSFNIYWYGGYDGLHSDDISYWNDAVWVLSLPSFIWTQVAQPRAPDGISMARAGHKCFMPYPDQMMVIGGDTAHGGDTYACITDIIQLFNVSSATWLEMYDPNVWSKYTVPDTIQDVIGGTGVGGALVTKPSSWDNATLGDVFQVAYAKSKITTWYPYQAATTTSSGSTPTTTAGSKSSSSGVPKFLAPLLGVIFGLIFIASIAVIIVVWRRRRLLKKNGGMSVAPRDEYSHRIISWINGNGRPLANKTETVTTTTEELAYPRSPSPNVDYRYTPQPELVSYFGPQEVANNEIVELPAMTPVAELSDVPMSPSDIVNRTFSGSHQQTRSSFGYSSLQQTDQGSTISGTSFARNRYGPPPAPSSTSHGGAPSIASSQPPAPTQPNQETRRSSSALPTPLARELAAVTTSTTLPEPSTTSAPPQRGNSEVSGFSEPERQHLRNISDPATVSTMDGVIAAPPRAVQMMAAGHRMASAPVLGHDAVLAANAQAGGLVSPPTDGTAEGEDYLGARVMRGIVSPVEGTMEPPRPGSSKRSVFREKLED